MDMLSFKLKKMKIKCLSGFQSTAFFGSNIIYHCLLHSYIYIFHCGLQSQLSRWCPGSCPILINILRPVHTTCCALLLNAYMPNDASWHTVRLNLGSIFITLLAQNTQLHHIAYFVAMVLGCAFELLMLFVPNDNRTWICSPSKNANFHIHI